MTREASQPGNAMSAHAQPAATTDSQYAWVGQVIITAFDEEASSILLNGDSTGRPNARLFDSHKWSLPWQARLGQLSEVNFESLWFRDRSKEGGRSTGTVKSSIFSLLAEWCFPVRG